MVGPSLGQMERTNMTQPYSVEKVRGRRARRGVGYRATAWRSMKPFRRVLTLLTQYAELLGYIFNLSNFFDVHSPTTKAEGRKCAYVVCVVRGGLGGGRPTGPVQTPGYLHTNLRMSRTAGWDAARYCTPPPCRILRPSPVTWSVSSI